MTRVPDLRRPVRKTPLLRLALLGSFLVVAAMLAYGLLFGRFREDLEYAASAGPPVPTRNRNFAPTATPPPALTITRVRTRPIENGQAREVTGEIRNDSQQTVTSVEIDLQWREGTRARSAILKVVPDDIPPGGLGYFQGPFGTWEADRVVASTAGAQPVMEPSELAAAPASAPPAKPAPTEPARRRVAEDSLCLSFDAVPEPRTPGSELTARITVMVRNGCDHEISSHFSHFHVMARSRDGTTLAEADGQSPDPIPADRIAAVPLTLYCDPVQVYRYSISRTP